MSISLMPSAAEKSKREKKTKKQCMRVQMMTDEMRLAGYNQVNYALAAAAMGALATCGNS